MTCRVDDCSSPVKAALLCSKHYQRFTKWGDPIYTKNTPREASLDERLKRRGWTVTEFGCWEWSGATDGWGYGSISVNGVQRGSHIVAYEAWVGPIEEGKILLHSCDNPPCINPQHLHQGTYKENSQERDYRQRSATAILTVEQVREIRRLRLETKMTLAEIGSAFDTSRDNVASIVYRKTWKNV
jgi:hypothetical protein